MFVSRLVLALTLATRCLAQQGQAPSISFLDTMPFHVSLARDLSSAKAKVGDTVELKYFGEIKDRSGDVLLSSKARFYGKVTDVSKYTKQQPEARLAFIVDRIEFRGSTIPLNAQMCGRFVDTSRPVRSSGAACKPISNPACDAPQVALKPGQGGRLPADLELRASADINSGSVLVSHTQNITIPSDLTFFVCQQRSTPSELVVESRPVVAPRWIPSGVELVVAVKHDLDAGTAKIGDTVEMITVADLGGPGNTIAIPKGANVLGRIVYAKAASKTEHSQLAFVAEQVSWGNFSVPLHSWASKPPVLSREAVAQIIGRHKDSTVDLREITVTQRPEGGSALLRKKKTIQLPSGSVLFIRQE
jgi:hypothetical protein